MLTSSLKIEMDIWQVRGVPEPRVRWFKDGEPLMASDRHVVGRTNAGKCTLTISDVADGDAGRYSCEAVNDQGRVCTLTVVQVIANRRIVEAERRLQGWVLYDTQYKVLFNFTLPKSRGFIFWRSKAMHSNDTIQFM